MVRLTKILKIILLYFMELLILQEQISFMNLVIGNSFKFYLQILHFLMEEIESATHTIMPKTLWKKNILFT